LYELTLENQERDQQLPGPPAAWRPVMIDQSIPWSGAAQRRDRPSAPVLPDLVTIRVQPEIVQ